MSDGPASQRTNRSTCPTLPRQCRGVVARSEFRWRRARISPASKSVVPSAIRTESGTGPEQSAPREIRARNRHGCDENVKNNFRRYQDGGIGQCPKRLRHCRKPCRKASGTPFANYERARTPARRSYTQKAGRCLRHYLPEQHLSDSPSRALPRLTADGR